MESTTLSVGAWLATVMVVPLAASAQAPERPGPCPAEVPRARAEVTALRDDPELAWARRDLGLVALGLEAARPLEGPDDAGTCARLRRAVPPAYDTRTAAAEFDVTFYELTAGYLVVITNRFDPESRRVPSGRGQTVVLDEGMGVVGTLVN